MHAEVLEARASGDLDPAGEGYDLFSGRGIATLSVLTRAEVKQATIAARDAGDLQPTGEGDTSEMARARVQENYARTASMARKSASVVASSN